MGVVQQVQTLLGSNGGTDQSIEPSREPAGLFRCHSCRETYISARMEYCPACEDDVAEIPTERDLGFV